MSNAEGKQKQKKNHSKSGGFWDTIGKVKLDILTAVMSLIIGLMVAVGVSIAGVLLGRLGVNELADPLTAKVLISETYAVITWWSPSIIQMYVLYGFCISLLCVAIGMIQLDFSNTVWEWLRTLAGFVFAFFHIGNYIYGIKYLGHAASGEFLFWHVVAIILVLFYGYWTYQQGVDAARSILGLEPRADKHHAHGHAH